MYPAHIEALYSQVPVGTSVTVVDQPLKLGWDRGNLYLEIHPSGVEIDEIEETGRFVARPIPRLTDALRQFGGEKTSYIGWLMNHSSPNSPSAQYLAESHVRAFESSIGRGSAAVG